MLLVNKARRDEPRPDPIPLTPAEREVRRILQTHDSDLQAAAMSNAVREALDAKNIERVVDAFPWDASAQVINQTASTFGQVIQDNIGGGFPKVGFKGRFDFTDPRSIEWATNQSAQLVTAVTDTTRNIIRETVSEAFTKNVTVYDTARKLRSVIGLNDRQAISFGKFIDNLDEQVRAGKITAAQRLAMGERQYKKMIKYRANMIARQEILMAENHGRYLGFTQAVEQGWAHPKSMKRWSTSTDERTCDICMPMNGKSTVWNESFPNGVFNPPAHIMCRCSISLLEPDSSLAQSFMEPAKIAPPIVDIPLPLLPTIPIGNLRTPEQAIDEAHSRATGISTFQYDAGQIENLNVTVEPVIFNGSPHTEIRLKLTAGAKTRLSQDIERSVAKDDGKWEASKGILLIDRKYSGKKIGFVRIPEEYQDRDILRSTMWNENRPDGGAVVHLSGNSNTYTAYRPDGIAIRFVTSKDAYAYDGTVRIMIPGKATPAQIEKAIKELGVSANRLPSDKDVEFLKEARIISLFNPNFGNVLEKAPIEIKAEIKKITAKWGFTMDEVTTEIDADGALRFLLPEKTAIKIQKETFVSSIKHGLGGYLNESNPDIVADRVVGFFTTNTKLQSQTVRKGRGSSGYGISEESDMETGGADYVFLRPTQSRVDEIPQFANTMVFDPIPLFRRTDYFGYHADNYGVKNPAKAQSYLKTKGRLPEGTLWPDTFNEIAEPFNSAEIMFQHTVDLKDLVQISVTPYVRERALSQLQGLGITEWNGRKIEDVIVIAKEYLP